MDEDIGTCTVSLRLRRGTQNIGLTCVDIFVILSLLDRYSPCELNLDLFTDVLRQNNLITQVQCDRILHRNSEFVGENAERIRFYLQQTARYISFDAVVSALRTLGCFHLADVLVLERFVDPGLCMTSLELPNATMMNRFYNSLKNLFNSAMFPNKLAASGSVSRYLRNKVETERNARARQIAFDKLVVVTCLRVNHHTHKGARLAILTEFKEDIPEGLETQSGDIIYCIGMCMTAKREWDIEAAQYHLDKAKYLNSVHGNSFFKFLIWHTQHLLFRSLYVRNPTRENFQEAMTACQLGSSCAVPEEEAVRQSWSTTFMMFSALLLLQIGQEFEVLPHTEPEEKYINEAGEIMAAAKRVLQRWSHRLEMMYQLCLARICQNTERNLAIEHCKEARKLAKIGTYTSTEKRNLKNFFILLQH